METTLSIKERVIIKNALIQYRKLAIPFATCQDIDKIVAKIEG